MSEYLTSQNGKFSIMFVEEGVRIFNEQGSSYADTITWESLLMQSTALLLDSLKEDQDDDPYTETGVYECKSEKCCYRFHKLSDGTWNGPWWPGKVPGIWDNTCAKNRTWTDLLAFYGDCAFNLKWIEH